MFQSKSMESTLIPLLLIALPLYLFIVVALIAGLRRLKPGRSVEEPLVSVVVAARNEEHALPPLLEILIHQTYARLEIIIVDDRSEDATAEIVRSYAAHDQRITLVSIEEPALTMPPKKFAITQGIRASRGEILCFTDADCIPTRQWVEAMVSFFDNDVGVVSGYSLYDPSLIRPALRTRGLAGLLQKVLHAFIAYEARKVAALSAGFTGLGFPWLCKASNLAYRRRVWDEVGGFEAIRDVLSGDDDLFLQRVVRLTSWNIAHATAPAAVVHTVPAPTFSAFVSQRRRHFSVGTRYPVHIQFLIALFHASNLVLLLSIAILAIGSDALLTAGTALALKLGADSLLVLFATPPPRQIRLLTGVIFWEILYLLYIFIIGPLGLFGKFEWKS